MIGVWHHCCAGLTLILCLICCLTPHMANTDIWVSHNSLALSCKKGKSHCKTNEISLFNVRLEVPAPFIHSVHLYEVLSNSIRGVFNAALTQSLGCLPSRYAAAVALQASLLLFTATLHI